MAALTTTDLLALVLLAPLALGLVAPVLERALGGWAARLLSLAIVAVFVYFVSLVPGIVDGEVYAASIAWAPALDLALTLRVDGLALLFALLITGIGALVVLYAGDYLAADAPRGRFFLYLLLFLASMLGIVLADNLIVLYVFWELTSITSFMLIGFEHEQRSAREAAQQALLLTGAGGLALLAGLLLLGVSSGTWEISGLAEPGVVDTSSPLVIAAFVCVTAGAVTKSAQFPFHAWLPAAMAAPTPVSAYLHSATMVKAGVFLLARMHPVLGDIGAWNWVLPAFGGVTMVVAAVIAIHQSDLKRILAYSTVSALGTMVFLIGIGTSHAMIAAAAFIVAHALYKAALFMVAGTVDHETGTRDRALLGGLRRAMPLTAGAAVLAGLSMAALPPALGFIAKESFIEVATEATPAFLMTAAAVAVGALTIVAAGMVVVGPFFGPQRDPPKAPHEGGLGLWLPPLALAGLGIVGGVLAPLVGPLLEPVASSAFGGPVEVSLSLWHGFTPILGLSAAAIAAGFAGYWQLPALRRLLPVVGWSGDAAFRGVLEGLAGVAYVHTRLIQNGSLRRYISIALLVVSLAILGVLFGIGGFAVPELTSVTPEFLGLAALLVATSLAVVLTSSRLRAVVFLAAAGFGTALLFVIFSAPDVAMAQVLVDTLIVILFVSVFRHLPITTETRPRVASRVRNVAVAGLAGGAMTALTWTSLTIDRSRNVSSYYLESSDLLAHGRNVVNTILVDFRALDTFGEITVLAIAAIGIIAVLRLRPEDDAEEAERP